ncbi:MAG: sulfur carrier protein ThiS [bacterium]
MKIKVNGEKETLAGPLPVSGYVKRKFSAPPARIAVAVNGSVIARENWDEYLIEDGDELEIVRPLQGG